MLRGKRYCLIVALIVLVLAGCEKVIDVHVDTAPFKYVIEGSVSDKGDSSTVTVSKTLNVFDPNVFTGIDNAKVTVRKDNGLAVPYVPIGFGRYKAKIPGVPGSMYNLEVVVDGSRFTAASRMPAKVKFDSLFTNYRYFLGKPAYIPVVQYTDPPGMGNAYRFVEWVRGFRSNTIFVSNDELTDGRLVKQELLNFNTTDTALEKHDWLIVEMMCIDMPVYNFWNTLNQSASGQSQTASPGNPLTNIQGGALGYFSAFTYQKKETSAE